MPTAPFFCLGLALSIVAAPALAASHAPTRKALVQPPAAGTACMNNTRMVSHVAYLPVDPERTMQCGHLLSTDTLLTVHHWDRT